MNHIIIYDISDIYFQTFFVHVKAKNIFIHPKYSGYSACLEGTAKEIKACELALKAIGNHDLCMIQTYLGHQKPKVWAPICLPDENWKHGEACHVSGWGASNPITGSIRLNSRVHWTPQVQASKRLVKACNCILCRADILTKF